MQTYYFSYFDLLPYIILLVLLFTILSINVNNKIKARNIFFVILVFSSIRYGIGYDYIAYKSDILHSNGGYDPLELEELVPRHIGYFARATHYQLFFVITSFLVLYPVYFVSKHLSLAPDLSMIVYVLHPLFFLDGLGTIRNAVAYSMLLLVFYYLYTDKKLVSFLIFVIACFTHKSAFIGFLLYPLFFLKLSKNTNIILFVITFIFQASSVSSLIINFAPGFSVVENGLHYLEEERTGGGKMAIALNLIGVLNFFLWNRLVKVNTSNIIYLNYINCGLCLWNFFHPISETISLRFSVYFLLFLILLAPSYCNIFGKKHYFTIKKIIVLLMLLFVISNFYIVIAYGKANDHKSFLPYQTIFKYVDYSNY